MKINYKRSLKFLCIFQIISIVYFIITLRILYSAHISPIYYNTISTLFKTAPADSFIWNVDAEEIATNFIYIALLVKIAGLIFSLIFYPDEYGDRKYNVANILASVLDIACVAVAVYAFIKLLIGLHEGNLLVPVWLLVLYFAIPFLLFAIACILHFACVLCVFIKQRKNSDAITVRTASLTKAQKISLCIAAVLACGFIVFSKFAPVAADKFIYGSDFEEKTVQEYTDIMITTIIVTNDEYGMLIGETTEWGPYFDFGSYTVCSTELLNYDGDTINMQCVIYSFDNDEEYTFEFAGKRKWFGRYELEMTSDLSAVIENSPKE